MVTADDGEMMTTNMLGMITIPVPVSQDTATLNIMAANHVPSMLTVDLTPPGPIRIGVTLNTITVNDTVNGVIDVGGVATSTFSLATVMNDDGEPFIGDIVSSTFYFAQENLGSFDADFPPAVVTSDGTFYAVRIIASTRLMDTGMDPLTSMAQVNTMFTEDNGQPDDDALVLLVINATDPSDQWMIESSFDVSSNTESSSAEVDATASLSDTNLLWAIASPLTTNMICYVQVRTLSRGNPLSGTEVVITQFFTQFGRSFFFRQSRRTDDTSGPVSHSACVPVLCGSVDNGTIRAIDQTYLEAYPTQPDGLTPMGTTITFTSSTENNPPSPFFNNEDDCRAASSGPYARFDLPIPNPPPDNPIKPNVANGYWYFRVQVHECLESNVVTAISADSDSNLLAICSRTITETEDYSTPQDVDPTFGSGMNPIICNSNSMTVTTRVACVRAINTTNVTLQVELHMDNVMAMTGNDEFCILNNTVSDFMNFSQISDQITVDFTSFSGNDRPDLGIYFDENSDTVARSRCMEGSNFNGTLNGTIAIFSCFL